MNTRSLMVAICFFMVLFEVTVPHSPRAQERALSRGFGLAVMLTTHRLSEAQRKYDLYNTNTGLDFGAYVNQHLGKRFMVQAEVMFTERMSEVEVEGFGIRINEEFLEIPVILYNIRGANLGDSAVRISIGVGLNYKILLQQELGFEYDYCPPDINETSDFAGYQKLGWIVDGGAALLIKKKFGLFLSYRIGDDFRTFGGTETVAFKNEYFVYGIRVGIEKRFGK